MKTSRGDADWRSWSLFALSVVLAGAGCSGDKCEGANCGTDAGQNGDMGSDEGAGWTAGFTPKNIALDDVPAPLGSLTLSGNCTIDSDSGAVSCVNEDVAHALADETDADRTPAMVFSVVDLTVEASADVRIIGSHPVIIIAQGEARILGALRAVPNEFNAGEAFGGGFGSPAASRQRGLGDGGGGPGTDTVGGSGGSYCGTGGGTAPGAVYGAAEVMPLRGGSAGGSGEVGSSGAGGGAIQIAAATQIDIASSGVIHVGGAGGNFGGEPTQPAAGGGSGGAVLLQAPSIRLAGTVSANGGGGGGTGVSSDSGAYATADGVAAAGGTPNGGVGSSVDDPAGSSGTDNAGGGGGAGWIRLETAMEGLDLSGVLSPSVETGCASLGDL